MCERRVCGFSSDWVFDACPAWDSLAKVLVLPRISTWTRGVVLAFLLLSGSWARAEEETAKSLYDKATGAYALGNYKRAAELYERAFELKPDPALLFNGAQAHRLAGNKERAYELYRSYLRVFPKGPGHVEAQRHADNLKRELEAKAAAAPVTAPPPVSAPPPAVASNQSEPLPSFTLPPPSPEARVSAGPESEAQERPVYKRPVFWVIAGAVLVAAAGGIVFAASRGKDKDPTPSWGGTTLKGAQ